jgi:phage terminase small subunit
MSANTPKGLAAPGRRLWRAVVAEYELAEHEAAQLEEACRVRDRIAELRDLVARDGLMIDSSQGRRLHPAIAEERQQRLALARLLATLGVPPLAEDAPSLPASRGVRGVYSLRGGAA